MAKTNPTPQHAASRQSPKPFARTPSADLGPGQKLLVNMMTEQRKIPSGFATFYVGTREEIMAAGVPVDVMKGLRKGRHFRVQPGGGAWDQELDAWLRKKGDAFELELHWSHQGPGHYYCHPLLELTARRMLQAVSYWTGGFPLRPEDGEVPLDRLAKHPEGWFEAVPSRPARFSKDLHHKLLNLSNQLFSEICRGEIAEVEGVASRPAIATDNVVCIKAAHAKRASPSASRPL